MHTLSSLGFTPHFSNQLNDQTSSDHDIARVVAVHRSVLEVLTPDGGFTAHLSGRHFLVDDPSRLPTVGDWVLLEGDGESRTIIRVLDRHTALTRGSAGGEATDQVLAANVDVVFIVAGLDTEFNAHRVERYLSLVWSSGATPVVVLNKADLLDEPESVVLEAERHCPGVDVITASAATLSGLEGLQRLLHEGTTAAFLGPSGVGKSSLINALLGQQQMDIGAVREGDLKGRHTTVHRQLIVMAGAGMVIDTPGLREIQLASRDGIGSAFPEIDALEGQCRFRDCTHESEPGCAVKAAVERGSIDAERYEHYLKLQHDARSFELRQDERQRRKSERVWGKLSREGTMIRRMKGDKN